MSAIDTSGTPFVAVTVAGSGGDTETVFVNPDQVAAVWPLRPNGDVKTEQPHTRLHLVDGERVGIQETAAEFLEACQPREGA